MKLAPILIIFFLLFLPSCKKYEEGPKISLRTKIQRLQGKWRLIGVYSNNIKQQSTPNFIYEIKKDGNIIRYYDNVKNGDGTWEWDLKKKAIQIYKNWITYYSWYDAHGYFHYYSDSTYNCKTESWDINKLTYKELKVTSLQGGLEFTLNFEKE